MKTKAGIIVVLALITIVIVYIVATLYNGEKALTENPMEVHKGAPVDFVRLFKPDATKKILLHASVSFKNRNPFVSFIYDHRYNLEITRIDVDNRFKANVDIIDEKQKPDGNYPDTKFHVNESAFITNYNAISTERASKIYLYLQGNPVTVKTKNDSVASYYLTLERAYLQYQPKATFEFFAEPKSDITAGRKAVSIMFVKQSDALFFLLLTPAVKGLDLNPNLLRSLLVSSKESIIL
jgi:hypothetical protein